MYVTVFNFSITPLKNKYDKANKLAAVDTVHC